MEDITDSDNNHAKRRFTKELQKILISFTLCKFYCWATDELKPYMKQYGGAHIFTTT